MHILCETAIPLCRQNTETNGYRSPCHYYGTPHSLPRTLKFVLISIKIFDIKMANLSTVALFTVSKSFVVASTLFCIILLAESASCGSRVYTAVHWSHFTAADSVLQTCSLQFRYLQFHYCDPILLTFLERTTIIVALDEVHRLLKIAKIICISTFYHMNILYKEMLITFSNL